jgi:putative ABC transport system permease protein
VLVNEGFALANGLPVGASVAAIINGRRRQLDIVGTALSPEFIYTIRPSELIPDDRRFGIFWMERRALAAAFDMEGGFNDVAIRLMPGASHEDVIARADELLRPYGGFGAIPRALQLSHWSIDNELAGLQGVGMVVPMIFMGIAAFLLNVVMTRIVSVQREQIAALKALGYANWDIGWHYTKWALAIGVTGAVIGTVGGAALGSAMISIYNQFFRFPVLTYRLLPSVVLGAVSVSLVSAVLGAAFAVRQAAALPPAEAMRPQAPARYRPSWIEVAGLQRVFSQPARMVFRNIQRHPLRSAVSLLGISLSLGMLIVGLCMVDSMDRFMAIQFNVVQRQDVTLTFVEPLSADARHAVQQLPGVLAVEPLRSVPARLRRGPRSRQIAIMGLAARTELSRVLDVRDLSQITLPPDGLVVSSRLADILDVQTGDSITVEVLEGERPVRETHVARIIKEFMGISAYMEIDGLRRLMREGGTLSGSYFTVDDNQLDTLYGMLKATPAVAGVTLKGAALQSFQDTLAQHMYILIFFNVLFASIIAGGVVYNAARISLSERSRELASLRVIGFTRAEISSILLGELAVLTLAAVPAGLVIGYGFSALIASFASTELYELPVVVSPRTYAFATLAIFVAAALSGLAVRRKLDHLNLVEVLKMRE